MSKTENDLAPMRATDRELLDVRAVAKLLDCCPRHVYRLCEMGLMPRPMKLGRLNRWSKSVILAWIAAGCPACPKEADNE